MLAACTQMPADNAGVPLDFAQAPRIRAGLWTLDVVIDGNLRLPTRQFCDGGRTIVHEAPASDVQWRGRKINEHEFLLIGSRLYEGRQTHARYFLKGDFSSAFVIDRRFWTDGVPSDASSDEAAYRYVGACPAGMAAKSGALVG